MKKLILILFILIISTFSIIAQSPCPIISTTPPNGLTAIGGSMTFTAKIDGISLENLKYQWTVSNGEITSGQGTQTINVATTEDMAGQVVTATVEINGFPKNCPNKAFGSGEIEALPIREVDEGNPVEYKKISWQQEKFILDSLAIKLIEEKNLRVLFRISLTKKNYSQILRTKSAMIKKYLITKHKIAKDRIIIVFGGNQDNRTEIYFVPKGVTIPF